jgi:hypothetical protein
MAKQILGRYTFYWDPDEMTMPYSEKTVSEAKTHAGTQIFEWTASIVGKEVTLKWDFMPLFMYRMLRRKYLRTGETYTWNPQLDDGQTFSVVIKYLEGTYFKVLKEDTEYRKDVIMVLSIRSKVLTATTTTSTSTTTT